MRWALGVAGLALVVGIWELYKLLGPVDGLEIGDVRVLQSPDTIHTEPMHTELMHSDAAGWWATLVKLRLPPAVPYLLPALRLAAANAVKRVDPARARRARG